MLMFFRRLFGTDETQCEVQARFKRSTTPFVPPDVQTCQGSTH